MGSFVPLGGFFSTPSDASIPLNGSCQHPSRCLQCDKSCEDDVIAASKGVFTPPLSEQYQSSLPSWMQMTELSNFDAFDAKVSVCFQIQFSVYKGVQYFDSIKYKSMAVLFMF